MKKKSAYIIIIITLINLIALGTIIYNLLTTPDHSKPVTTRKTRFEQVKQKLLLTPSQINHFKKIRTEFHTRLDLLDKKMDELRSQLLQRIWQPRPQIEDTDEILIKISQLQTESQRMVIWHFYKFKEILTSDQWQKFYKFVSRQYCVQGKAARSSKPMKLEDKNK